jgi:hypothetical protein
LQPVENVAGETSVRMIRAEQPNMILEQLPKILNGDVTEVGAPVSQESARDQGAGVVRSELLEMVPEDRRQCIGRARRIARIAPCQSARYRRLVSV